jgi:rubredoxin
LSERRFGRAAPETAVVLDELAGLIAAQGRHEEAEPHYRRALAILERALGAGHPSVLAALAKLRSVYAARGDRPDEQDAALYRGFFICPRCGGRLMHEKDTSSGTEMRSYYCPACRWMKDEDRGPALWAVMSEARRDDPG